VIFHLLQTEQIRRANHLWTNDSLFLRDKLLIPVSSTSQENNESSSSGYEGGGGVTASSPRSNHEIDLDGFVGNVSSNNQSYPLGENGSFKMQPHWSHPLCDSFDESEDCIVNSSSGSVNLKFSSVEGEGCLNSSGVGDGSTTSSSDVWSSSKDSPLQLGVGRSNSSQVESLPRTSSSSSNNGAICNDGGAQHHNNNHLLNDSSGSSTGGQLLKNSKHYSSMDNGTGLYQNSSASDLFFASSSTAPGTPTSPDSSTTSSSRRRSVVDHSEKSAKEFLSRIDTAIASSRMQAQSKSDQEKPAWVTFDSDSESDHRNSSGGTSITRQGRHLRYSLRKLEKAQEELFQL
jgi:hypothetical protein